MLCVVGLGFSDTAYGQLSATPSTMSFQVQSGGASSSQNLTITSANGATTLSFSLQGSPTWLTVNSYTSGSTFPLNMSGSSVVFPVSVNTAGLNSGQTYSGTFTAQISGLQSSLITYTVALTVGTPTLLSANPATLSFSATQGATQGSPNPANVSITSSGQALNYNISLGYPATGPQGWIQLSTTTGTTGGSAFSVYVNPGSQQLTQGTYTGTILVSSTTTGDTVTIPVTLSVTAGSVLNVTGTLSNFVYQSGSQLGSNQQQTLMISTSSGSLNYQVQLTAVSGPGGVLTTNWLVSDKTGGLATTTPQTLTLSLSSNNALSQLSVGTYVANISICPTSGSGSCPTGGNTTVVPATLVISNNPLLNVTPSSLSFTAPFASGTQSKTLNVTSSGGTIPYTVSSSQSWLTASLQGGTTSANPTFSVTVNPSGLQVSTTPYSGIISVQPNNTDAGLYSIQIPVSLTVTSATSVIYAGPDQLLFSYQTTQGVVAQLSPQLVQLTSSGTLGFTVTTTQNSASNCPTGTWLTATPNQSVTPATLTVGVAPTQMTGGSCSGTVIVTYNNGSNGNSTVIIPVTVDISTTATPLLTITPPFGFGVFTASTGSAAFTSQISINSTDGSAIPFSANVSQSAGATPWLSLLGSSTGVTQQYLTVQISPKDQFGNALPVGVYTGSITIHATNSANLPSGDVTLPVVLTVSANTTVALSPTSLTFKQAQGATTAPASQQITLTATGGSTTFTAAVSPGTGGNWLQITPLSGTASGTITASVALNTLSPGIYNSNITLQFQNSATPTTTIPVQLIVSAAQLVTVTPASLNFSYQLGAGAPATQTLNVVSSGGPTTISVGSTSSNPSGWLSVTPTTGTTGTGGGSPLVLTVSVAPAVFTTTGTFTGTITITPLAQSPITVNVTVTVTGVPVPQPSSISNSASGVFGVIAPGELITIKGTNLGPTTGVSFSVGAGNTVSSTLSGVQVLFDNIPGTPTYVSATQINVVVPYEIAGRTTTNIVVSNQNQLSAGISQSLLGQAPGIYTFSATGAGQAAVLNQNGTYNGPSAGLVINGQTIGTTPAAAGQVISVYMTGGGQTSPTSTTGTVTPVGTLYKIPGTVTATINGVPATVTFAGDAPALVTGVVQVNILIPPGVSGNGLSLAVTINGSTSVVGPTIAVQ